jgi:uncharacterized protein (DUF697 family)
MPELAFMLLPPGLSSFSRMVIAASILSLNKLSLAIMAAVRPARPLPITTTLAVAGVEFTMVTLITAGLGDGTRRCRKSSAAKSVLARITFDCHCRNIRALVSFVRWLVPGVGAL